MLDFPYCDREWKENANGNFVCIQSPDHLVATVFRNKYGSWQIIIAGDALAGDTVHWGRLVKNEYYVSDDDARERAEAVLGGAPCELMVLLPRD